MKKNFCLVIIMAIVLVFCSACDGDVTRALRHSGFSVGSDFVCDDVFPSDKEDTSYEKIKYLTSSHIITEKGKLYEISMGQQYASNSNCRVADTDIEVVAIMDNKIVKSSDGKFYYIYSDNSTELYSEVTPSDNYYQVYELLLKPEGTIKVITADSSEGLYYVLKNDGNVYGYTISSKDKNSPPTISGTTMIYNKNDYSGEIVDFNYAGNNTTTFVRTKDKAFKMGKTNSDECSKYVDVECKYELQEFSAYSEYKDFILAYNGSMIITNYGRTFNVLS